MITETVEQIEQRLIDTLQANASLYDPSNPDPNKRGLTSTSQVAVWRSFLNVIAIEIFTLQQLMSTFSKEVEGIANDAPPETPQWVRKKVLEFQYDAVTPQVVQVNADMSVTYEKVDTTKQVIDQCAVISNSFGGMIIKVAAGNPLAPITSSQRAAIDSYLNTILGADINYQIINEVADILKLIGTVYYNGQYNSVIKTNVVAALNNYLSTLPFNGVLKVSDLIKTILNVEGVTDVELSDVVATPLGGLGTAINLITSGTENMREYQTYSGYVVNDPANLFANTLTFLIDND